MASYEHKKLLKFIITLGTTSFTASGTNQITLKGFRSTVDIDKAGGMMMGTLRAKIYGVRQEDMNSITTLQWGPRSLIPNTVQVFTVDGDVETQVFAGNIVNAWGDYMSMPDVFLHIQAQSAYFSQLKATAPRSYSGTTNAATVMGQIAAEMQLTFENNGVNVQLSDVYLANTATEQAKELAQIANCDLYIDDRILAITPRNGSRTGTIPLISAKTGLVGYPTFDGVGVNFKILFNAGVTFGGRIKLETDITRAAGEWVITSVSHQLTSEMPSGAWFSNIRGNLSGFAITR